jgi:uncharacterized membrane protein YGL010W
MPETDRWLTEYGDSHRNVVFPPLFWVSVPVLVLGTVGFFWSLPIPAAFADISPVLNWGTAFLMAAVVYYFIISVSLAIGILPIILGITAFEMWLQNSGLPLRQVSAGLILGGIVGLYLGHYPRGGTSAVVRDIQLMMIAPLWVLAKIYRRLGIPL